MAVQDKDKLVSLEDLKTAYDDLDEGLDEVKNTLSHKADAIYDTASGSVASFPDGADGLPVKDLTVGIEPVQSGTGDPSPTNVRPISGWTGANVTRTGKNLVDISRFATEYPDYCSFANGVLSVTSYTSLYNIGISVDIPAGAILNWSITNETSTGARCRFAFEDGTATGVTSQIPYTAPKRITSIRFDWTNQGTFTVSDFQAEIGSSASAYEPYNPASTTLPISWQSSAGTVYGGTLDVTSGVLTMDREYVSFNGTNYDSYLHNNGKFFITMSNSARYVTEDASKTPISNFSKSFATTSEGPYFLQSSTGVYVNKCDAYQNIDQFKEYAAENPMQFVMYLRSPQIVQLSPTEVLTLLGQNNIWADCGPSTVEYPCDTKLYIQKINTPTDDDMIADANIASGKYFIVNNNLYISTAAILAGDPIKPGTNCTLTNLAAALNAINS